MMTIPQLYEKLKSEEFLDPSRGIIAYNYYIYPYPANREYEFREQIEDFKENLIRPNTFADVLCINLYEELCDFLKSKQMMGQSMLEILFEKEADDPEDSDFITDYLMQVTQDPEFYKFLSDKINTHLVPETGKIKPYIFVYGIGSIYPYLRVNRFLATFEDYNQSGKYRVIVFYPGDVEGNYFKLFGVLTDRHNYRAVKLINHLQ